MILHTIIDPNEVINNVNTCTHEMVNINNCVIDAVLVNDEYVVDRVISTNPKDYLNCDYQLGRKIPDIKMQSK